MKRFFSYVASVLVKDNVPVWMTLAIFIAGAFATYLIAPLINEKFEIQAARREFLVHSLNSFSAETKNVIDAVFESLDAPNQILYDKSVHNLSPSISKLQFSSTQLLYVVPDQGEMIVAFQRSLDELQDELIRHRVGSDAAPIVTKSKELTKRSLAIYESLLRKTGLHSAVDQGM